VRFVFPPPFLSSVIEGANCACAPSPCSPQVLTGEVAAGAPCPGPAGVVPALAGGRGACRDAAVEDFLGVPLKPSVGFLARRLLTTAFALASAAALAVFTGKPFAQESFTKGHRALLLQRALSLCGLHRWEHGGHIPMGPAISPFFCSFCSFFPNNTGWSMVDIFLWGQPLLLVLLPVTLIAATRLCSSSTLMGPGRLAPAGEFFCWTLALVLSSLALWSLSEGALALGYAVGGPEELEGMGALEWTIDFLFGSSELRPGLSGSAVRRELVQLACGAAGVGAVTAVAASLVWIVLPAPQGRGEFVPGEQQSPGLVRGRATELQWAEAATGVQNRHSPSLSPPPFERH